MKKVIIISLLVIIFSIVVFIRNYEPPHLRKIEFERIKMIGTQTYKYILDNKVEYLPSHDEFINKVLENCDDLLIEYKNKKYDFRYDPSIKYDDMDSSHELLRYNEIILYADGHIIDLRLKHI